MEKTGEIVDFYHHIDRCNQWAPERYRPFCAGSCQIGWIREDNARWLRDYPSVLSVGDEAIVLADRLQTPVSRTEAMQEVVHDLVRRGAIKRFRDEACSVKSAWRVPEWFCLDRSAVPFFGVKSYGVHINGFFYGDNVGIELWIGKRSAEKQVEPGKFDSMVAGGQPAGLSLRQNLRKEGAEEAGLSAELVNRAMPAGAVSYCMEDPLGLKVDTMFVFDLLVPGDFVPCNQDGEVSAFEAWPVKQVLERLRGTFDFKFNVALVLIDFMVRHGVLMPDTTPEYERLCRGLRVSHPGLDPDL